MLSLLFLIPIALALTALIVWAFLWAVRDGQYEDLERSGKELLYEDSPEPPGNKDSESE